MKLKNWKAAKVLDTIAGRAIDNANAIMDEIVFSAKAGCPVDPVTFREGKFGSANISFTPKTGRNKGKLVSFSTDKRWMGRSPGNLRDSIRRVNSYTNSGSVRVYAGDFKIYWALFIERGYHDRAGKFHGPVPFLRRPFNAKKTSMMKKIKFGV